MPLGGLLTAGIAGAAGIGTAGIGAITAGSARGDAQKQIEQSIADLTAMGVPTIEAQKIVLNSYKSAGQLTPELEQAITQAPSNMGGIDVDPTYKEAQLSALHELGDIGQSGGMRLSDQATAQGALGDIAAQERGKRDAITADMRGRGVMGSGLELASKLDNQQNAATNANQVGLDLAGKAQDRSLEALKSAGSLGGTMQGQEFGQKAQVATAQDAIDRFNAATRGDAQTRNVTALNAAKERNLTNDQRIMDANTGVSNEQEKTNKGLYQQQYEDQLQKETAKANARSGLASNLVAGGNATQQTLGTIGQGIAGIGSAYLNSQDPNKKKTAVTGT
jgi:hypothetical protein